MPSCIIKGCKNKSCAQINKGSGVTFHKFPVEIMWNRKWTKAVRRNRNEEDWQPSKFSVVCSSHFEECDIYYTKCGLRRIVKNAIPKKGLFLSQESEKRKASNVDARREINIAPKIHDDPISLTIKDEVSSCESDSPMINCVYLTASAFYPEVIIATAPNNTHTVNEVSQENEVTQENEISQENEVSQENEISQDDKTKNEDEIEDFSDLDSVFDSPLEAKLRKDLRRKEKLIKNYTKKIKSLNQKNRRLMKRVATYKEMLKAFKTKKCNKSKNCKDNDSFSSSSEQEEEEDDCNTSTL